MRNKQRRRWISVLATLVIAVTVLVSTALADNAAVFGVGSNSFATWDEACNYAQANGQSKIVLLRDYTLTEDIVIPSGITLLIPFDSANTLYTNAPAATADGYHDYATPTPYRTLTMADGASITVNGAMSLSAKHATAVSMKRNGGSPSGPCSFVKMEEGSKITVNNGGFLYAWGFITGSGEVEALDGAVVYENFQVMDFRGGTQTISMENGVFPLSQYYVQNIEVPLKLWTGAEERSYTTITMLETNFASSVAFIAKNNAMFNLTSGYVVKEYDGSTDRLIVAASGKVTVSPIGMDVGGTVIDSSLYELPINGNISVTATKGSTITIAQDLAFLPGSEIILEDGAACNLTSGVNVYFYDADDWGNFCSPENAKFFPVGYAPGRTYTRTEADLVDAKVKISGAMNVSSGHIYTTAGGAAISGAKDGAFAILTAGTGQNTTYQLIQANATQSLEYKKIPITPAKLKNTSEEELAKLGYTFINDSYKPYVMTAGAQESKFMYRNGLWHEPGCNGTFTESLTATCTTDGYKIYTCDCGYCYQGDAVEAFGHNWSTTATSKVSATCTTDGYDIHACTNAGCTEVEHRNLVAAGHTFGINPPIYNWTQTNGVWSCTAIKTCNRDTSHKVYVTGTVTKDAALSNDATCTTSGTVVYVATFGGDENLTAQTNKVNVNILGHDHKATITPPTCQAGGYTTYTCSRCGDSYKTDYTNKVDHDYDAVVTEPTCGAGGYTTHTCIYCGHSYKDTLTAATTCKWITVRYIPATCTVRGYREEVCEYNSAHVSKKYLNPLGHSYITSTSDATCTEPGGTTETCQTCGNVVFTQTAEATGHQHVSAYAAQAASCTKNGLQAYWYCADCDGYYKDSSCKNEIADFESWKATSTEQGGGMIPAVAHVATQKSGKTATCQAPGYLTYYQCGSCSGCFEDQACTVAIPNLTEWQTNGAGKIPVQDHKYTEYISNNNATCEKNCTETAKCDYNCGATDIRDIANSKIPHKYTTYVSDGNATCTADGTKTAECDYGCDTTDTVSDVGSKLPHSYKPVVTPPTCTEGGYTTYTCSSCSDSYVADKLSATGHNYGAPTYSWAADNSTCTATKICTKTGCGHPVTETVNSVSNTDPATCDKKGSTKYTATFTDEKFVTQTKTVEIPATGHTYGDAEYTWEQYDGKWTCTAVRICKNGAGCTVKETASGTVTSSVSDPATCEEVGTTTYTATFDVTWTANQTKDVTDIPALEHMWVFSKYEWTEDGKSCTAYAICSHDSSHTTSADADIADKVTTAATCESMGTTTYTATFDVTWALKQTKAIVDIPAIGHSWGEATYEWSEGNADCTAERICSNDATHVERETVAVVPETTQATCEEDGAIVYTADFTNEAFVAEITVPIPAIKHDWGEVSFVWSEDYTSCTATRICGNDASHKKTETKSSVVSAVKEATCEEGGYTTYAVYFTDEKQQTVTVDHSELGHDYGETAYAWSSDNSTCIAIQTCINDNSHVVREMVDTTSETTPAGCETEGKITYTATFEGTWAAEQTKEVPIPAKGHDFGEWIVDTAPTCTETGETRRDCGDCDAYETEELPALDHDYVATVTLPTCTEEGYTTHDCSRCDDFYVDTPVDATGHSWGDWNVTDEPDCTEAGERVRTCGICAHVEAEEVDALGHSWGNWNVITEKTCTADGEHSHTCGVCDAVESEPIPASHNMEYDAEYGPTCTESGTSAGSYCKDCEYTPEEVTDVPALGHAFTNYTADNNATCTMVGTKTATCDRCDATDTISDRAQPALGHDFDTEVTAPTCIAGGYTTHTCQNDGCEYSYTDEHKPALNHAWGEVSYEWNEDHTTCTATRTCSKDTCSACVETEQGTVTRVVTNKATCEVDGEADVTAAFKNAAFATQDKTIILPATGHDWSEVTYVWSDDKTSCTASRTCGNDRNLEHAQRETVTSVQETTAPTCYEAGETVYTAQFENEAFSEQTATKEITKLRHIYGSVVTTRPTCTEDGYTTYICTQPSGDGICGRSYTSNYTDALGHHCITEVTEPTCTEEGYTTYTCDRDGCEYSYIDDIVDFLGHSYTKYVFNNNATCTKNGTETAHCDHNCGKSITRTKVNSALGHAFTTYVPYEDAECGVDATEIAYCDRNCKTSDVRSVEGTALTHSFTEYHSDGNATCIGNGTETASCDHGCGNENTRIEEDSALGHNWSDWTAITEVTCTDDGEEMRTCARDSSHTEKRTVYALGHDYVPTVIDPTCTEEGYTLHDCSKCDVFFKDTYVDPVDHSWGEWYINVPASCTVVGESRRDCSKCDVYETEPIDALGHSYEPVVTAPTCKAGGYTTYTCETCGHSYEDNLTEIVDHKFSEYVSNHDATCTEDGSETASCDFDCGAEDTRTDVGSALGHAWGDWETTTPSTCEEEGEERRDCTECDAYETNVLSATGHNFDTEVTEPTCIEDGYTTHTCSSCGDSYVDSRVDAIGHDYGVTVVIDPTCTTQGYTTYTCSDCPAGTEGHSYVADYVPATGHDYSIAVVTDPTCTEPGYTTYSCPNCSENTPGHSYDGDRTSATGHSYEPAVTPPTCTEGGYTTYTCSVCGDSYIGDETEAAGHNYQDDVTPPTCTEKGYTTYTCVFCPDSYVDEDSYVEALGHTRTPIPAKIPTCTEPGTSVGFLCATCGTILVQPTEQPATGHQYNTIVTEPTCTEGGYTTHTCTVCGDFYTDESTEATGHSYQSVVTEPTCTKGGYTTHTCSSCGDSYMDAATEATGHDYKPVVTEPTCTEQGYTTYTCHCGDSYVDKNSYVDELGHKFTQYVSNNNATCIGNGTKTAVCDRNGCEVIDVVEEEGTAKGHLYTHYVSNGNATCTQDGTMTASCDNGCRTTHSVTEEGTAKGHSFTNYESDGNATCTTDGTKTAKCDRCDDTDTIADEGSTLGHSFVNYKTNGDATCTEDGTKTAKCERCDVTDTVADVGSAKGHLCIEYLPNNDATCTQDGTMTAYCVICNTPDTIPEEGSAKGHNFAMYIYLGNATCTQDGTKTAKCTRCDVTDTIPAVGTARGHGWAEEWTTNDSHHWHVCETAGCTLTEVSEMGNYGAHVYTDDADATCNECGYEREIAPAGPVLDTTLVPDDDVLTVTLTPTEECTSVRYAIWADGDQAYTLHWANATFDNGAWVANVPQCALPVPGNYIIHIYDFVGETPEFLMESTFTVAEGDVIAHTYSTATDHTCDVCGTLRTVPMFRMYDPNSSEHFYTGSEEERDSLVAAGWNYEGVAFNFPAAGAPVYRLYEEATGEHLYTMDEAERAEKLALGWNDEGIAFNSASTAEVPQYRLRNPNATRGRWHFTGSEEERDFLVSLGWIYEGIGWYSSLR